MSELPKTPDAHPDALEGSTTRHQAPAWVGSTSGAYIVGTLGLIGWGLHVSIERSKDIDPVTKRPVGRTRTRVYIPKLRLTPLPTIQLCSGEGKGYRGVFDGSWVYYSSYSLEDTSTQTHKILARPHVAWAEFKYWQTGRPEIHDLVLTSEVTEADEVNGVLKWARECKAELGLNGVRHGNSKA